MRGDVWIFGSSHLVAALDPKHSLYTCARLKLTHGGETNGMRVERGKEGEEIYTISLRVPAVARFSFFCFALATDFLALRYNHLTIRKLRNNSGCAIRQHSIACPCNFISQTLSSLLERNAFFMRTHIT